MRQALKDVGCAFLVAGEAVKRFRVRDADELFAQIGYGRLGAAQALEAVVPTEDAAAQESLRPSLLEKTVRRVTRRDSNDGGIVIGDMDAPV